MTFTPLEIATIFFLGVLVGMSFVMAVMEIFE